APCDEERSTNEATPRAFASQTAREGVHQEIGGGVHRQHTADVVAADEFGPAAFGKGLAEINVHIGGAGAGGGPLQNVAAAHANRSFHQIKTSAVKSAPSEMWKRRGEARKLGLPSSLRATAAAGERGGGGRNAMGGAGAGGMGTSAEAGAGTGAGAGPCASARKES